LKGLNKLPYCFQMSGAVVVCQSFKHTNSLKFIIY